MSFYLDDDIFKKILQMRTIEMKKDLQIKENKKKYDNVIHELNVLKSDMIDSYAFGDYEKYDCYEDEIMDEFYGCCMDNDYYMTEKIGMIDPVDDQLIFNYLRPHHTIFKYMLYMNLCL
jgi:hypothetical protein|tara:strand:+ start:116 stop:472 length:357 start_codon:yes stop_codon:yes gene_type:complete